MTSDRYDLNGERTQVLSRPDIPTTPWLARKHWGGDTAFGNFYKTGELYQEMIMHVMLAGSVEYVSFKYNIPLFTFQFLFWNWPPEADNSGFPDAAVLSYTVEEVDSLIGW